MYGPGSPLDGCRGERGDKTRSMGTCRTGKLRYEGRGAAKKAAKVVSSRLRNQTRAYACPFCGGYHLTSQAKGRLSRAG